MSTELKTFRDSLSHSFTLFAVGHDAFRASRLIESFNQLLDHEIANLERRLTDREQLHTMSTVYLEKPSPFEGEIVKEKEKEIVIQSPTLVIQSDPEVVVTKYDAPPMIPNEFARPFKLHKDEKDEEVEADEELEEPAEEVEEPVDEEEEDDEETEIITLGKKKKYHVGVRTRTVYEFLDEETMGEVLGTLRDGKIVP